MVQPNFQLDCRSWKKCFSCNALLLVDQHLQGILGVRQARQWVGTQRQQKQAGVQVLRSRQDWGSTTALGAGRGLGSSLVLGTEPMLVTPEKRQQGGLSMRARQQTGGMKHAVWVGGWCNQEWRREAWGSVHRFGVVCSNLGWFAPGGLTVMLWRCAGRRGARAAPRAGSEAQQAPAAAAGRALGGGHLLLDVCSAHLGACTCQAAGQGETEG